MPKFMFKLLSASLILGGLLAARLSAQLVPEELVHIRFSMYCYGVETPNYTQGSAENESHSLKFMVEVSPGKIESFEVPTGSSTQFFDYTGPPTMTFFREVEGAEGQVVREELAQVKIPENWREAMILMFPLNEGKAEDMRILPINVSPDRLEGGEALLINASKNALACHMGDQSFILNPFKMQRVTLADRRLSLQCALRQNDELRVVYSSTKTIRLNKRYVFVLLPSQESGSYRMIPIGLLPGTNQMANIEGA